MSRIWYWCWRITGGQRAEDRIIRHYENERASWEGRGV